MTAKNFKLYFIGYFVLFGIIITIFTVSVGHFFHLNDMGKQLDASAEDVAGERIRNELKLSIEKMDGMVDAIHTSNIVHRLIESPHKDNVENARNLLYALAYSDKQVMQARVIDRNGHEIVRVDRSNEDELPFVVDSNQLQDKSGRDYFQIVSAMKTESTWHSKLDLNIEHGQVEVPFRPTIRIAKPFIRNGQFEGMVIVNLLMKDLLKTIGHSSLFDHYLVDKEGYFLLHPDNRYSWNRWTGKDRKLSDEFVKEEMFWKTVYRVDNVYSYNLEGILNNHDELVLILKPKESYITHLEHENVITSFIMVLLSMLLSIPLAIYVARTPIELQRALHHSFEDLKRFSEIIDTYVLTLTTHTGGIISAVSKAFCENCGYKKEELLGQNVNILRHPSMNSSLFERMWTKVMNGKPWHGEIKNRHKNGSLYWLDGHVIPLADENGKAEEFTMVGIDITAKKELEKISSQDKLTKVYTRRKLDESVEELFKEACANQYPFSIILLDIDHFKQINDTFGHQSGDSVLSQIGEILLSSARKTDRIGRYGGEEFLIACFGVDQEIAQSIAEKIRQKIEKHHFEGVGHITASFGVATLRYESNVKELFSRCDEALYRAKNSGRNRVCS